MGGDGISWKTEPSLAGGGFASQTIKPRPMRKSVDNPGAPVHTYQLVCMVKTTSKSLRRPGPPAAKRKLLDATMALMRKRGYAATTVDEICAAAKLTKGSFFHYFEGKEDIAGAALDHYCALRAKQMSRAAFHRQRDPLERFHEVLDFFASQAASTRANSCLLGNVAQELAQTHPQFQRKCADRFGQMIGMLAEILKAAKVAHPPAFDFAAEGVAALFVSVLQGSLILSKARRQKAVTKENLEHYRRYIESLFGRARQPQAGA